MRLELSMNLEGSSVYMTEGSGSSLPRIFQWSIIQKAGIERYKLPHIHSRLLTRLVCCRAGQEAAELRIQVAGAVSWPEAAVLKPYSLYSRFTYFLFPLIEGSLIFRGSALSLVLALAETHCFWLDCLSSKYPGATCLCSQCWIMV